MERYTPQERAIITTSFLRHNSSVVLAQREFRRMFPNVFLWGYLKSLVYVNKPDTLEK